MSLHDPHEQRDPGRGAEGRTHVRGEGDAAHEAQGAPAPVLLPAHQPAGGGWQSETGQLTPTFRQGALRTASAFNSPATLIFNDKLFYKSTTMSLTLQ